MSLNSVKIIELPKFLDERGNLSFLEGEKHVPFEIKRSYWIYDVPGGARRGGHAYHESEEVIIALSGSFEIVLNDGKEEKVHPMNRSYNAIYVPNGIWRSLENFSTNSLCLVLSSTDYDEKDYVKSFTQFNILNNE